MAKVYGIDLGTTYSAIATLDDNGLPMVIENFDDTEPLLASAVYFAEDGTIAVGKESKNQAEIEPHRVVQFVKREIGKPDAPVREFNGENFDPIMISSLILKRMKEYAQAQGHEVNDVVITCPAYFGIEERNATRQAGIIAGLNVLNIINEPTAAALNYCCREFRESRRIMVYDLGGGTFDITLFDFTVDDSGKATIDVIMSDGNDRLGGVDWDQCLYDHICALYSKESGIPQAEMDAELRQKIRAQVESVKRALTNLTERSFTINYAGDPIRLEVTREQFESITKHLVEQTMDFVRNLLSNTGFTADNVDVVLLVGGSTMMPMVKNAVEAFFPGKVRVEQPHLAVAKGAALAAAVEWNERLRGAIEQGGTDGEIVVEGGEDAPSITREEALGMMIDVPSVLSGGDVVSDKISRSFGPAIFNEQNEFAIENLVFIGDKSPTEASATYGTRVDNQSVVEVMIYENVASDRENCYVTPSLDQNRNEQYTDPALKVKSLGKVRLELPAGMPKGSPIRIVFRCSAKGLEVEATNVSTGETVTAFMQSQSTISPEELSDAIERFEAIKTTGQL